MLEVKELVKRFRSGEGYVQAVNDISFSVPDGSFVAVVGKSGSGKSTLLALLGALDKPTTGSIKVDEQDITRLPGTRLTSYRRKAIGFVFQNYQLVPNLTAVENVMLPMEFAGVPAGKRQERAEQLLSQVGIDGSKLRRYPGRLSGGEQQRVAIARALANKPFLILADEPTGNLDNQTGKTIVDLLRKLAKDENVTIITVTHDETIAKQADKVYRMQDGKFIGGSR